jgi:hypothetical protein
MLGRRRRPHGRRRVHEPPSQRRHPDNPATTTLSSKSHKWYRSGLGGARARALCSERQVAIAPTRSDARPRWSPPIARWRSEQRKPNRAGLHPSTRLTATNSDHESSHTSCLHRRGWPHITGSRSRHDRHDPCRAREPASPHPTTPIMLNYLALRRNPAGCRRGRA